MVRVHPLARGVTVARLTLDQLVLVRIQAGQQLYRALGTRDELGAPGLRFETTTNCPSCSQRVPHSMQRPRLAGLITRITRSELQRGHLGATRSACQRGAQPATTISSRPSLDRGAEPSPVLPQRWGIRVGKVGWSWAKQNRDEGL